MSSRLHLTPQLADRVHPRAPQVHCLKELRELESSSGTPTKYKDYVPENLEVKALLSRDKNITDDLYKAAVADTLIITMKVQPLITAVSTLLSSAASCCCCCSCQP